MTTLADAQLIAERVRTALAEAGYPESEVRVINAELCTVNPPVPPEVLDKALQLCCRDLAPSWGRMDIPAAVFGRKTLEVS